MEKVQIIPPPKEVDPRVLAWKGAAVLGKMDGVADLWVTPSDWVNTHAFYPNHYRYLSVNNRTFWACVGSKNDASTYESSDLNTIHESYVIAG
jgi:hypothetical protein